MTLERVTVTNYQALGELIKSWSKGGTPPATLEAPQAPNPKALDALAAEADKHDVGLTIPKRIKKLRIIYQEEDTLTILVPLQQMVLDAEQALKDSPDGYHYPLPAFYVDYAGANEYIATEHRLAFHSMRVGDYSTGQCG